MESGTLYEVACKWSRPANCGRTCFLSGAALEYGPGSLLLFFLDRCFLFCTFWHCFRAPPCHLPPCSLSLLRCSNHRLFVHFLPLSCSLHLVWQPLSSPFPFCRPQPVLGLIPEGVTAGTTHSLCSCLTLPGLGTGSCLHHMKQE